MKCWFLISDALIGGFNTKLCLKMNNNIKNNCYKMISLQALICHFNNTVTVVVVSDNLNKLRWLYHVSCKKFPKFKKF